MAEKARRRFGSIVTRQAKDGRTFPGFYVLFRWKGQRYRRHAGRTRRDAERALARVEGMLLAGKSIEEILAEVFGEITGARATMRDLAPHFIEVRQKQRRATTVVNDTQRLNRILKAPWTARPLGMIRRQDIERWAADRRDSGLAPSTVNRDLAVVSAFFAWARQRGFVESNPVRDVERYSEAGRGRLDFLSPEECRALLAAAEGEGSVFRAYITAALLTGARRAELMRLRWRDVDLAGHEISFPPEADKIGQGRTIPMAPDLEEELGRLSKARRVVSIGKVTEIGRGDPIFAQEDGSPLTPKIVASMMDRTKRRLDLPPDRKEIIGFHVLRHTCASLLRQAGVDLPDVGRIMGHRCLQTTLRYAHLWADGTKKGVKKLGEVLDLSGKKKRRRKGKA